MYEVESREEARRISEAALQLIDTCEMALTPDTFRLMYDYVSQRDPVVSRELNQASSESSADFRRVAMRLIRNHYGSDRALNLLAEAGEAMSAELRRALTNLNDASEDAADFGIELSGFANHLDSASELQAINAMVEEMVLTTRRMQTRSRQLESDLKQSSSEISNLQAKLEETRRAALIDALTGLSNRAGFDHGLQNATRLAQADGTPLSLVMCDIDHFKRFNDKYGHQTGDQVLKLVGGILRSSLKGRDLSCRYGGEEFALILPQTVLEAAWTVAEQVRETIGTRRIVRRRTGEEIDRVTMSFGVAQFRPGDSAESLLARADSALYRAKRDGRNRVVIEADEDVELAASA